jgi:uncharacterized membrane protein
VNTLLRRFFRPLLTGTLAALPLLLTIAVIVFTARLLYGWVGPGSLVGDLLTLLGFGINSSEFVSYLLGIVFTLAALYAFGLLVEHGLQRGLAGAVQAMLRHIPVVRSVYDMIQRFVQMLSTRDEDGLNAMSPVWCHFGGVGGAAVLALLSCPEVIRIGERDYHAVLVPTAPVPVGGGLLYLPVDWVTPADIGVEALTSLYVSMGVTSPKYLPLRPAAEAPTIDAN